MPKGKCGICGNHPRSKTHVDACGVGRKEKVEPEAEFVLGQTCIGCNRTYSSLPFPSFQLNDAKHGHYEVTRQLPQTSENYPICARCLPWYWRVEAKRNGMEREVAEVYAGHFQ